MIFDRVQSDIDTALSLRERLGKGEQLTDDEIAQLEKGTLTINTLNRIEEKQTELKNLFAQLGYYCRAVTNREWSYTDYFMQEDFDRIRNNLEILRNAFFVYKDTPQTPSNNYRQYQVINDTEKILYDLDLMISDVKSYYRECGTFECGEE